MSTDWQNIAPRIYLDSCILIDSLVDRDPRRSSDEILNEVPIAKAIFQNWPKECLFISPFVIGEFVEVGKSRDMTEADMIRLVKNHIASRCTVAFADEDEIAAVAEIYESFGLQFGMAFSMNTKGTATNKNGIVHTNVTKDHVVFRDGTQLHGIHAGKPPGAEPLSPYANLENPKVGHVSAPLFELAFFHRVAGVVHGIRAPWKDAFHFYYAKKSDCYAIITNDKGLLDLSSIPRDWPRPIRPSDFKAWLRSDYGWGSKRFFEDIFGSEDPDPEPSR
jgi:hypothetical protein